MTRLIRVSALIASYIPFMIVFFFLNAKSFALSAIINQFTAHVAFWTVISVVSIVSLIICVFFVYLLERSTHDDKDPLIINQFARTQHSNMYVFFFAFSVFFISIDVDFVDQSAIAFAFVALINCFIADKMLISNPLLRILGFHVYTFVNPTSHATDYLFTHRRFKKIDNKNIAVSQFGTTNMYFAK